MVSIPDGGDQNADKLAGGGDGCVCESAEPTDGEEDEVLPDSSTKTEQENVPCGRRMSLHELHCLPASSTRPPKQEEAHVD